MADDLFGGPEAQSTPVDISDLVTTAPLPVNPLPLPATRNAAVTTALVADPGNGQEHYNNMMNEAQKGDTTTQDMLKQKAQTQQQASDFQTTANIMADPTIPLERKKAIVDGFAKNRFLNDTGVTLQTNMLSQGGANETSDTEKARISTVDALHEMADSRKQIQTIVNGFKEKADSDSNVTKFFDDAAGFIPFRNQVVQAKTLEGLSNETGIPQKWWEVFRTYAQPGSDIRRLQAHVASLPPDQQLTFVKALAKSVTNNSGFLYGNDNHQQAYQFMNKVFNTESYGGGSEFLDNSAALLDLFFVGQTAKDLALVGRNAVAAVTGQKGPLNLNEARQFQAANANTPSNVRIEPTFGEQPSTANPNAPQAGTVPNPGVPQQVNPDLTSLQARKAELLAQAGNEPGKGNVNIQGQIDQAQAAHAQNAPTLQELQKQYVSQGMKAREAKVEAQKELDSINAAHGENVARLQRQATAGAEGSRASQEIAEIDQQIAHVQNTKPTVALNKRPISEAIEQTMSRIKVQGVTHDINPASSMEIVQNSNPDAARAFHEAIVKGDDEVASAFTGTNREQAIINNTVPQASESGTVFSRTGDIDLNLRAESHDPKLVDLVNDTSVNPYSPTEAAAARAHIVNDFGNSTGLQANDAMTSFSHNGGRTQVKAVYELPAGSWSNPEAAVEQASYALRHYGITPDDITLLRKDGVNHVPVTLDEARGVEGDYKIQVNTDLELNPSMLSERDTLDVKRNWFDRFAGTQFVNRGSVNRYIFDAASTLHKTITSAAGVAKDYGARFEKYMLGKASEYSDAYKQLSKGSQAKIDDYVREANFKGIAFDQVDLAARGFNANEVGVIRKWRNFWDDHYFLENLDVVRTLRSGGYEHFKNTNAELYARPIGKTPSINRFYDPATDTVRGFNAGELDDLYNKGGHLSAFRRPTQFGGDTVDHMIIRQSPTEYSRALKDSDRVLNYKEGYYTITYKAAKFIDEVDANGKRVRTLAVAGDTKEANAFAAQHTANNPGVLTRVRNDTKGMGANSDEAWDINSAGGRIAQRHRGKLLEDASAPNHLGDMKYVANPVESAVRAAKSISGRTVMRPMLESAADRVMKNYARVLPKTQFGETRWPNKASEIGAFGETSTKEVADARTTWEYLNFLRSGYINGIDDGYKAVWNQIADSAGAKGFPGTVERGLRKVGELAPTTFARRRVNDLLIASSPLRQLIVQSAAAYRAITYNPIDYVNGKIPRDMVDFLGSKYFGKAKPTPFLKFLDDSGLVAAVEHHTLTSATLTNLADEANGATRAYRYTLNKLRTIGFDAGETMNIVNHASAVFRRYERLGKDLNNKDVREQAMGEIRALTYNMNAAGDMPYNSGTASALFQFMQMPHKAVLQFANRQLDTATKIRMGIGDMLLWGTAIDGLSNALNFDFLPPNDTVGNKVLHDGLISVGYNGLLQKLFSGTHEADFGSLSPYGFDGWQKLFFETSGGKGVFGAAGQAIANSPAGGVTSKIVQVYKDMSRLWSPMPYDDGNSYEKFQSMVSDVAKLSSGWSNLDKAKLMVEAGNRRDKFNSVVTDNTTTGDVIAQMFGFTDRQQAENYKLSKALSGDIESRKQDVLQVYTDIKKFYANKYAGNNVPDFQYMSAVTGAAMQVYKDDPQAMATIQKQIHADITGPDQDLMFKFFQSMQIPGHNDVETQIARGPWDEATKGRMRQAYEFAKNAQNDLTELTKGTN